MSNIDHPEIPEVILESEKRHQNQTVESSHPGSLGLPALPSALLDLAVKYLPVLALAGAAINGFNAFGFFIAMSATGQTFGALQATAALVSIAAALMMGLSYIWLAERRRLGWNMLAGAIIVQLFGQFLVSGAGSILYAGIEVLLMAYILLQLRDSYSN